MSITEIRDLLKHEIDLLSGDSLLSVQNFVQSIRRPHCSLCEKHHDYNAETKAAIEEGRLIAAGVIPAKTYSGTAEMFADILADTAENTLVLI